MIMFADQKLCDVSLVHLESRLTHENNDLIYSVDEFDREVFLDISHDALVSFSDLVDQVSRPQVCCHDNNGVPRSLC